MAVKKTTRKTTKITAKRKPVAKRSVAKRSTAKTTVAAKHTTVKKAAPVKALKATKDPMTKSQVYQTISDMTGLNKKQVSEVFDALGDVIHSHFKRGAVGLFNLIGLLKLQIVRKPATKARKGINPFTGEETMFKAKPARNVVKARALKKLKDMAA